MLKHTYSIEVVLLEKNKTLKALLTLPEKATTIVIFAHGSGSSRLSPRNQYVSHLLESNGLATLLLDLLTEEEEKEDFTTRQYQFDVELLAKRLLEVSTWLSKEPTTQHLKKAYFGVSAGSAAALKAAKKDPSILAIISRGGRPDIALNDLPYVLAPTLLIVGSLDTDVLQLNQQALQALTCSKKLHVVEGATHLFEENGALEEIAQLTFDWIQAHS